MIDGSRQLPHIQYEHLCPCRARLSRPPDIPPQPPPITSDGQFPLKRGQIYCATECAEGFLGRSVRTAEVKGKTEEKTWTNWVPSPL